MTPASRRRPLVVIGDALLDRDVVGGVERLSPDAPVPVLDEQATLSRPGGAGLAALLAAGDGREVTLVTALAADGPGGELAGGLADAGIEVIDLGLDGATPEKVRVLAQGAPGARRAAGEGGRPLLRIDRGDASPGRVGPLTAAARAAIGWAEAVLVSDYGRGVAAEPGVRAALAELAQRVPIVWDPHPRGAEPVPGAALATPNADEAHGFCPEPAGDGVNAIAERAAVLARRWAARHVCVTRGAHGAVLVGSGPPLVVPADPAPDADPCGAGDRFASAAAGMLADGAAVAEAVIETVSCASAFVACAGGRRLFRASADARSAGARAAGSVDGAAAPGNVDAVIASVRSAGGTVVATGGCFDLIHAGHVRTVEAARSLGDCLVVCLNSDASVRRVKGAGRPLVPQEDRAAVLLALGCVDAVAVFDEDTPEALLERIRPDVWAKGGDYAAEDLPERAVVERHGGRAVVLPYLAGRSTTRLIEEVTVRAIG